jgi:hypothetical protein
MYPSFLILQRSSVRLAFPALFSCICFVVAQQTQLSSPLPIRIDMGIVGTDERWHSAGIQLALIAGSQHPARTRFDAFSHDKIRRSVSNHVRFCSEALSPHSRRRVACSPRKWYRGDNGAHHLKTSNTYFLITTY